MSEGERRYRSTLDSLLEGFQILAFDWTYLYVNPAAARHGRRTPQELVGLRIMDAYPGIETTPLFEVMSRCMTDRTNERLENQFDFGEGLTRWFELRIEPVPEGICIHSVDIEARKNAEDALRDANADLERRIADRTAELEQANRELQAFSYSVAHDLRTPLRSIDGFAQLLHEDCGDAISDQGKDYIHRVRTSAQRMASLIDDLLGLSRVTLIPIDRTDVDLSELARSVIATLDPEHRIRWRIESDLHAQCDRSLARIVLENLLGNAVKFTSKTPEPEVSMQGTDDDAIAIADNGAGFDMAYAAQLFRPFQRLHAEREFGGTGIGLSTVERIVRRHDGFVRAEGIPNEGATITFRLSPPRGKTTRPPSM